MDTKKLTLYVDPDIRTRVKTAASHSDKSISDFLLPYIEEALKVEEERMRKNLGVSRQYQERPSPLSA